MKSLFLFSTLSFVVFETCSGKVLALRCDGEFVENISGGQLSGVLLDQTCFYAEQGGQMYDTGFMVKTGDEVSVNLKMKRCDIILSCVYNMIFPQLAAILLSYICACS